MFNTIDLFAGAGGLSEGFHKEGFSFIAHIEKDPWACETLRTRIFFHRLKEENKIETYYEYIKRRGIVKNPLKIRDQLINKELESSNEIYNQVLNMTFGDSKEDPNSTPIYDILNTIENIIKRREINDVDLVIGGPPCQSYSVAGRGRMGKKAFFDKRNYLFNYFKKIVEVFKPKLLIFENVPGILSAGNGIFLTKLQEEFDKIDYVLQSGIYTDHKNNLLNAIDFGVPQVRKRLILFGCKKGISSKNILYPDFKKYSIVKPLGMLTTRDAIGDLPFLQIGEGEDRALLPYVTNDGLSNFQKKMRKNSIGVINHRARLHKKTDREIYKIAIKYASNNKKLLYWQLPEELRTHKNKEAFTDRFKVHWWDTTPHTIVAHIGKDGHYNIHPDINQCRSLTVREAARIQSFPDNYIFEGPRTSQYIQVGNAVPPLMSQAIARSLYSILKSIN